MVEIFGWIALWIACQLPLGILLGRCLKRASEQDLPEAAPNEKQAGNVAYLRTGKPWRAFPQRAAAYHRLSSGR